MRTFLRLWGWLIIGVAILAAVLYTQHALEQSTGVSPEQKQTIWRQYSGHVGLCLMAALIGWLCRPISRRHRFAMVGGFVCTLFAIAGLVASSNMRKVEGPFYLPELASRQDVMFLLTFFMVPVAVVVAGAFAVLVNPRSD